MENFLFFSNDIVGGDILTFWYRHRKKLFLGSVLVVFLITGLVYFIPKVSFSKEKKDIVIEKKIVEEKEMKKEEYQVDIKGQILSPGIYSLPTESRVIDVIEKAGGLTEQADTSVINLSKKIQDEMVIIIYSKEEVQNFSKVKEKEKQVQEACHQKDENALVNSACINSSTKSSDKVSINQGTLEEFMKLSGIGESKAKDIISYREKNGPFQDLTDLKKIPGIGDALFAKIQEDITL